MKIKREKVEINNTNAKEIQKSFEQNGWELESVRLTKEKMVAIFILRQDV